MNSRILKILVTQLGPLGNWLLATGAYLDIRNHYPDGLIYHFTRTGFLELAERQGCFDHILTTPWVTNNQEPLALPRRWRQALSFARHWRSTFKGLGFDLIFDLHGGHKLSTVYLGTAPSHSRFFRLSRSRDHMLEVYRETLSTAGIQSSSEPYLSKQQTSAHVDLPRDPYVVFIPCSERAHHNKNWPLERFMSLAANFHTQAILPVIAGVEKNLTALEPLRKMPGNLDMVGKLTLPELATTLYHAKLVVGVDTGTTHMASILGSPTVGLFGPTDMHRWKLCGATAHCFKRGAMHEIQADEVWAACQHLMTNKSACEINKRCSDCDV